jgi:hypothetical protein
MLVAQHGEKERLLANHLCPADGRIQSFIYDYLQDVPVAKLPFRSFCLDRPGMARTLSLPVDRDEFSSEIINSNRVLQGVLHYPRSDRRTTAGIFHVAEGGLPVPDDKIGVPKAAFAKMLGLAFNPPRPMLRLPFTATQPHPPSVSCRCCCAPGLPEVPGYVGRRWRFVSLRPASRQQSRFRRKHFRQWRRPNLPENDAGLGVEHWTSHTGCVVLAPHLTKVTKQDASCRLGTKPPNASAATARAGRTR